MRRCLALFAAALGLAAFGAAPAQDVLPVPPLTGRVIDQTAALSAAQQQALEAKLAAFETRRGTQIVVLIVPSTQPEDIAAYAQRVGDTWKIGRRDVGDGLLIVVAKNERRVNIQTTKALEGAVPDLAARRIIDTSIRPAFRADDYAGGLNAAVDALMARIEGEGLPGVKPRASADEFSRLFGDWNPTELLIFAFVALPIVAGLARRLFGRGLGSLASAAATGMIAWVVSQILVVAILGGVVGLLFGLFAGSSRSLRAGTHGGAWGGGFGGGGFDGGGLSSGGGGFSSGGGGDFGGGGASGDW